MKTLFEIPVYSLKKEDFEKRLELEAKKQFKHSELMNPMLSREYIWRFNQIIGYIVKGFVKLLSMADDGV